MHEQVGHLLRLSDWTELNAVSLFASGAHYQSESELKGFVPEPTLMAVITNDVCTHGLASMFVSEDSQILTVLPDRCAELAAIMASMFEGYQTDLSRQWRLWRVSEPPDIQEINQVSGEILIYVECPEIHPNEGILNINVTCWHNAQVVLRMRAKIQIEYQKPANPLDFPTLKEILLAR